MGKLWSLEDIFSFTSLQFCIIYANLWQGLIIKTPAMYNLKESLLVQFLPLWKITMWYVNLWGKEKFWVIGLGIDLVTVNNGCECNFVAMLLDIWHLFMLVHRNSLEAIMWSRLWNITDHLHVKPSWYWIFILLHVFIEYD